MPTRILLSLKPRFAEAILAGEKRFEYRRSIFRRQDIDTVVIYASTPICKVVGEFSIKQVLSLDLEALWEETRGGAAIDRHYFDQYFKGRSSGYALEVKEVTRYELPLCLRLQFKMKRPPQSFCYL
ncbi:MAG: ASCH domain-containing protein [Rhodothermaceae bacterium]|nr:ASCH domain-containing protein [Rhodothermaceae bacterium]MYD19732.1 ASCH domain-containing protein [Rhodothermaceae bacterium]MYD57376.1 ASCH domain-containing protein [Rhodothermaceae bacterium]MYI43570.1 ASCH domain-containing protein [Rhodothermaceae bacterium]MYJ56037.1 ASCH domain-containing protein [Rhodothermaceae bacterium]